jgi:gluconolactonase
MRHHASSVFARGLGSPEGPLLLPDRSWLLVEMAPDKGSITRLSADGTDRSMVARTGRPNGLARDKKGNIWVAESSPPPSLLRVSMTGDKEVILTACDGAPFLFPNDLAFGPDAALYLSDSGIRFSQMLTSDGRIRNDLRAGEMDGRIYRIDTRTAEIERIDSGLRFANGLAFGPDGHLYVSETVTGTIYRYRFSPAGPVGSREVFGHVLEMEHAPKSFGGPDGMAFGRDGRLFVAMYGLGHVAVLGPEGNLLERIPTMGAKPTNVAFGASGEGKIYVTEDEYGVLEGITVDTDGLPLIG